MTLPFASPPAFPQRRPHPLRGPVLSPLVLAAVMAAAPLSARAEEPAGVDFTKLSLEELMDVEVTSVSKRRQRVADAAAAIFVIGQEDIRRSGATSVPELLRMAPGVEVARIDANKWAVSIRGFNGRFSGKLQVLIDGRSVYSPLFSGVFWDAQDVVLEDVDRIEVIRGPGATVWGANAVNGVINIITKSAKDTQGVLLSGGAGTQEFGFGTARYGGKAGDKLAYRGYLKSFTVGDSPVASGDDGADATHQLRSGFRIDADPTKRDLLTLSADLYKQDYGSTAVTQPLITPPFSTTFDDRAKASGGNVLGRWTRTFSDSSSAALQGYYDRFVKSEQGLGVSVDIADLDFQHEFGAFARNQVVWGLGYRYSRSSVDDSVFARLDPNHRIDNVFSAFVQDEIALIKDELRLTLGSKFEQNDTTGLEIQPTARILWSPTQTQSVWASVSRAVRVPSLGEEDAELTLEVIPPPDPFTPPVEVAFMANPGADAEELLAFELGYRAQPIDRLSFDIAAFYNQYDNLAAAVLHLPRLRRAFALSVDPEERRDHLFSAFVQDEISLVPDELRLTLGAKLEHNASTGFEIQPSVRTIWTPSRRQAVWAAASRAVRTPTIADDDATLNRQVLPPGSSLNPGPLPVLIQILGDRDLEPIELYALESGYRIQPTQTLSLDFAAFLNIYDNLRSFSAGPARYEGEPSPGYFVVPFTAGNASKGTSHGFEAAARWTATPWWRLDVAYTYLELDLQDPGDLEGQKAIQGTSPRHQASLRSTMDLGSGWEFDLWPRYVADLESNGVDAYVDLDARLGWRLTQGVDLSLVGQNLLGGPNQGFTPELLPMTPTQQNRVAYGRLTLRF